MIPLKIHNGGSYVLMEYLTYWEYVIFHAVTAFLLYFKKVRQRIYSEYSIQIIRTARATKFTEASVYF